MVKEVMVTVRGMLFVGGGQSDEDYIDVITPGQYYWKNNRHVLVYEEIAEGADKPIRNILQISDGAASLRKYGVIQTEMVFDLSEETYSHYSTPFGLIEFGVDTEQIRIAETNDEIKAEIRYTLKFGPNDRTNCFIRILVQPRTPDGGFTL